MSSMSSMSSMRPTSCPPLPAQFRALCDAGHQRRIRALIESGATWSRLSSAARRAAFPYRKLLVDFIQHECRQCKAWGSESVTSDVDFTVSHDAAACRLGHVDMTRSIDIVRHVFQQHMRLFPGVALNNILAFFDINFYFTNFAQPLQQHPHPHPHPHHAPAGARGCLLGNLDQYHMSDEYDGPRSQYLFAFCQLLRTGALERVDAPLAGAYTAWLQRTASDALRPTRGPRAPGHVSSPETAAAAAAAAARGDAMTSYFDDPSFPGLVRAIDAQLSRKRVPPGASRQAQSNRVVLLTSLLSGLEHDSYRTQGSYCVVVLGQMLERVQRPQHGNCGSARSSARSLADPQLHASLPGVVAHLPDLALTSALENACFAAAASTAKARRKYTARVQQSLCMYKHLHQHQAPQRLPRLGPLLRVPALGRLLVALLDSAPPPAAGAAHSQAHPQAHPQASHASRVSRYFGSPP